jgi:Lon protease-like protein
VTQLLLMDVNAYQQFCFRKRPANRMISDQEIPTTFPIFPLAGAVLFPQTRLPLNIFEPRYLNLIDAVLAGSRYVGMLQPRSQKQETITNDGKIYDVGCLGRLTAFAETEDGRYVVTLTGITRFRIMSELAIKDGYRSVQANLKEFDPGLSAGGNQFDRAAFMETLKAYLITLGAEESQETFEHAHDRALVTTVAMSAPFRPEEKQAILECSGLSDQASMVRTIMEMATYDGALDSHRFKH